MGKNINEFRKNILLAGKPGFLAEYMTACLQKEGFDVFDLSGDSFALRNPYGVFYFSAQKNDGDLLDVLQQASEHHVKYFYYVTRGRAEQQCYENFVIAWGKSNNLQTAAVHLPEIFGPGQKAEEGVVGRLLWAVCQKEEFQLHGSDEAPMALLYARDAAYALFSVLQQECTEERIEIVPEQAVTFTQIVLAVNSFASLPSIEILGGEEEFAASWGKDSRVYELKLRQKYPVLDMLQSTLEQYGASLQAQAAPPEEHKLRSFVQRFRPYLENIGLFLLVFLFSFLQGKTPVNSTTGLDICYLYIIIMGIMYGKKQSMPAIVPSMLVLGWGLLNNGEEIASIFYLPENLFHFSTYVFLGVFTGYVRDGWRGELDSLTYKLQHFAQRYGFLQENYQTAIAIKDKLYYQIANSDDSIGWFYGIIRQLDTVEVEDIFTQAAAITSRIMGSSDIAIYVMGKDAYYVRQRMRLGNKTKALPRSRKVADTPYLNNMLENHHLFVNHGLQVGVPDLAAPIVYEDELIAVIEVYDMDFEQWSIYQQNLLSVTARLISMAIGKAYRYESGIQEKRFLPNTRILREEEFAKLVEGMRQRAVLQENVRNMLLELGTENGTCQELDERLKGAIRLEDAVGLSDGKVFLLLYDTDEAGLQLVMQRLLDRGIAVKGYRELV